MIKLKDMKDAPRDGTEILAMTVLEEKKNLEIIKFYLKDWINGSGTYFEEEDLLGWIDLPEITE